MIDRSKLRQKARESIEAGRLPASALARVFAGPGTGACCAICARPIDANEMEYEVEFAQKRAEHHGNVRVHTECFLVWESVVQGSELLGEGNPS
jgi:hypothetical protein